MTAKPTGITSHPQGNGWHLVKWDALASSAFYESQHEDETHVTRLAQPQSALLAIPRGTTRYTKIRNVVDEQPSGWVKVTLNDAGEIIDIDGDDPEPEYPNPPRNVQHSDVTATSARVSWQAPAPGGAKVDHYHVAWSRGNTGQNEGEDTTRKLHYAVSGLKADSDYAFAVTAVAASGRASKSVITHFHTEPDGTSPFPDPPGGLRVVSMNVAEGTAEIAWDSQPDADYWEVLLENVFGGYRKATSPEYTFYDLVEGQQYSFRVRAVRKHRDGKLYRSAATRHHFTFEDETPPPPPPVPVPKPEGLRTHCTTQTSTKVEWNDQQDVDGWEVWIGDREQNAVFVETTLHTIKGLKPGTWYTVNVVARSGDYESEAATHTFQTSPEYVDPEGDLPTPEGLNLAVPRPGVLQARWKGVVPAFQPGQQTEDAYYISIDGLRTQTQTDGNAYEWRGLSPGEYTVELYRANSHAVSGLARMKATVKGGW